MSNELESEVMVIAKHNFVGRNNDELSFNKNDVFSVIQMLDGGWWEGTFNGKVGWFPSNFVGIINTDFNQLNGQRYEKTNGKHNTDVNLRKTYHDEIITTYLEKLKKHVKQLDNVCENYFTIIKNSKIFTDDEYLKVIANTKQILDVKYKLLSFIEKEKELSLPQQRFGRIFLDFANEFYPLLKIYCGNHCTAIELLNLKSDELLKLLKANNLDLKNLISYLSAVFRHFEKYSATIQEIERNIPETHSDRGNLQRACEVYCDFYSYCEFIRKQKSIQLEFLRSKILNELYGSNWKDVLGECIYIGNVSVSATGSTMPEHIDDSLIRYIAVFSKYILLFEAVLTNNNLYALKNRISCTNLLIAKDDSRCLLSFKKGLKNVLLAKSLTIDDYKRLLESLNNCLDIQFDKESLNILENGSDSASSSTQNCNQNEESTDLVDSSVRLNQSGDITFLRRNNRNESIKAKKKLLEVTTMSNGLQVNHELEMILPDGLDDISGSNQSQQQATVSSNKNEKQTKQYSGWCLRPLAPPRGEYLPGSASTSAIKMRKGLSAEEQDDALVLKIVEGYCNSGNLNNSVIHKNRFNTSALSPHNLVSGNQNLTEIRSVPYSEEHKPQLIVAENEKIFVEEIVGDEVTIKERSLVDTVYALKDQLDILQKDVLLLTKSLDKEQKARRRFEELIRTQNNILTIKSTTQGINGE